MAKKPNTNQIILGDDPLYSEGEYTGIFAPKNATVIGTDNDVVIINADVLLDDIVIGQDTALSWLLNNGGVVGDVVDLGGGNDVMFAGGGNDLVFGGDGNDQLRGEDGNDLLFGQDGNDKLDGGAGEDELHAGQGEDTVFGGKGAETDHLFLDGGEGGVIYAKDDFVDTVKAAGSFAKNGTDHVYYYSDGSDEFGIPDGLAVDVFDFSKAFDLVGGAAELNDLLSYDPFSGYISDSDTNQWFHVHEGTFATGHPQTVQVLVDDETFSWNTGLGEWDAVLV